MTADTAPDNVRHWTLEEALEERESLARQIRRTGVSVEDLRYRASEWELEPHEQKLLAAYERFDRMVTFASGKRP